MKLRIAIRCFVRSLIVSGCGARRQRRDAKPTFASVLDHQFTGTEKTVVPAADAMPADKYDFAPTQGDFKGVRTFGAEIKHMAVANYFYAATILGEKPPVDLGGGPDGPANIKSKAEIMKFLNDSFVYAHKAINSITEANVLEPIKAPRGPNTTTRLALAISLCSHPYRPLRPDGRIPPHEQHHSARQPEVGLGSAGLQASVPSSPYYSAARTIRGPREAQSLRFVG